jgi:hypothetical protein
MILMVAARQEVEAMLWCTGYMYFELPGFSCERDGAELVI